MTTASKDWSNPLTYRDSQPPALIANGDGSFTVTNAAQVSVVEEDDLEVLLLTSFPNNDMTTVSFPRDSGNVFIEQIAADGSLDCVLLDRDMVVELIGVLNTYVRATAK